MSTSPLSAMLHICAPPGLSSGGGFLDDGAAIGSGDGSRIGLWRRINNGGAGGGPCGCSLGGSIGLSPKGKLGFSEPVSIRCVCFGMRSCFLF